MTAIVVPLRHPNTAPTLAELVAKVRVLAEDTDSVEFLNPHVQMRMSQRGVSMRQVLETLRKGDGMSGPKQDEYGDWRIKLRRLVAGRRVQVVVAVKEKTLALITVI